MRKSFVVTLPALVMLGVLAMVQQQSVSAAASDFQQVRAGYYIEQITNNPDQVAELFGEQGGDARAFGLSRPTQITFDDNGNGFVAEKQGRVRVVIDGELQPAPVLDISARTNSYVDRGMNGIAVKDGWLYVAYTHESGVTAAGGTKTARISKFALTQTGASFSADSSTEQILVGTLDATAQFPSCNDRPDGVDCIATDSGSHTVGNLNFGPDSLLYASIGDGAGFYSTDVHAFNAQKLDHLSGKILRLTTDGSAAPGNPFFNGGNSASDNISKVWVYGLRNPTFFNFDPRTGALLAGNVGWYSTEAAYRFQAGDNAGWPCVENGVASVSGYERMLGCPLQGAVREPFIKYSHEPLNLGGSIEQVGAITGIAVPTAAEYPEDLKGTVAYPDYVLGWIKAARLNSDGSSASTSTVIGNGAQGAVGLRTDGQGFLYFMIHEQDQVDGLPIGTLYRLRYNNDPNAPIAPVALFKSLASGDGALSREFDASGTYDPAGRAVTYSWDFGDGSVGAGQVVPHTYSQPGDYVVTLTATAGGVVSVVSQDVSIVSPPDAVAYPVIVSESIFGSAQPRPDGVNEFAPSTAVPISFDIRNLGEDVAFFVVVNVRLDGERVGRFEDHDQNLATSAVKSYAFEWTTATPGEYTVDVEFYDEVSGQDLQGRYPSAASFVVTTRVGNEPTSQDCVDEGDGNTWGYDPIADTGCWLTTNPPDLNVCTPGDNNQYHCPDGLTYTNDRTPLNPDQTNGPTDPTPINPNCVDEGDGNTWGYDPIADTGCWLTTNPPDLNVCTPGDNNQYHCPDGLAYLTDGSRPNPDQTDPGGPTPVNPNCVDEGDGNSWGYDPIADTGCWLTANPPDLNVCIPGDNNQYFCPDGLTYTNSVS